MATILPRRARPGAAGLCALCVITASASAVLAQSAVSSITTREGSRSTGRTGAPLIESPAIADNPHAWPLPNGAQGWQTAGQPLGQIYPALPVGQSFDSSGLTSLVPPPPKYVFDRQGNELYVNPITGLTEAYGTNIQRVR